MQYPKKQVEISQANESLSGFQSSPLRYPKTRRQPVKEILFGKEVEDPYRWLENTDSKEVMAWIEAQNAFTGEYLSKNAAGIQEKLSHRFKELLSFDRWGIPVQRGQRQFQLRHKVGDQQAKLIVRYSGQIQELVDPVQRDTSGNTNIADFSISYDGEQAALLYRLSGRDKHTLEIVSTSDGSTIVKPDDTIRFSNVVWNHEGAYYISYPEDGAPVVKFFDRTSDGKIIPFGVLKGATNDYLELYTHPAGQGVFVRAFRGAEGNQLWYLASPEVAPVCLIDDSTCFHEVVAIRGPFIYILSNREATNFNLTRYRFDGKQLSDGVVVLEERDEAVLEYVVPVADGLLAAYLQSAVHHLIHFDWDGELGTSVALPANTSIKQMHAEPDQTGCYIAVSSFAHPVWVYRFENMQLTPIFQPSIPGLRQSIRVQHTMFKSFDGTKVPMFLIYRSDLNITRSQPTYLYGYGGFGMSMLPSIRMGWVPFIEAGGIVAVANIRGGSENGRRWHEAGRGENKHRVFKDFIAAAKFLKKQRITTTDKLIIGGRSNGGLLVGAVMTMEPQLAGVALPSAGLLDMVRYQQFTVGHFWKAEYGDVEEEKGFKNLFSFSPLHNIKPNTSYPATFITTGDKDERVAPAHSYKFTAALQHCQKGSNPILLRIDRNTGHGVGKSQRMLINEQVDIWSFVFHRLGMEVP